MSFPLLIGSNDHVAAIDVMDGREFRRTRLKSGRAESPSFASPGRSPGHDVENSNQPCKGGTIHGGNGLLNRSWCRPFRAKKESASFTQGSALGWRMAGFQP